MPAQRLRLGVLLFVRLGVPYLLFVLRPGLWVAAGLVAVASFGFAVHLGAQERYLAVVPERIRGQALGLAGSGMQSSQAVAAAMTGTLAEVVPVSAAMAAAGLASLVATACLLPVIRSAARPASR